MRDAASSLPRRLGDQPVRSNRSAGAIELGGAVRVATFDLPEYRAATFTFLNDDRRIRRRLLRLERLVDSVREPPLDILPGH
jgi:hypothetical protein